MSIIKSIITNNKIELKQKIERLNILIQKGIELNPKEEWKNDKRENSLLFATHCCSLIHKQNIEKLTQLEQRLKQLKAEKYCQNTEKMQKISNIINELKSQIKILILQKQNNYTDLLNSFIELANELEVSKLKDLIKQTEAIDSTQCHNKNRPRTHTYKPLRQCRNKNKPRTHTYKPLRRYHNKNRLMILPLELSYVSKYLSAQCQYNKNGQHFY